MSETATRALVYAVVNGVSNVGQVHDYERWANDWTTFLDRFKATISSVSVIRGWTITCAGWTQDHAMRVYTYKVRGYFGLDDSAASEKAAMLIVDAVCQALDISDDFDEGEMAELTAFEPRMFGTTLCHYAEITFRPAMAEVF
jgi:hypothetical protein